MSQLTGIGVVCRRSVQSPAGTTCIPGVGGAGQYQARTEAGRRPREGIGQRNNGINVDWFGLTERIGKAYRSIRDHQH